MTQPGDIVNTAIGIVFLLIIIVIFIYIVGYFIYSSNKTKGFSPLTKNRSKLSRVKNANLSLHI